MKCCVPGCTSKLGQLSSKVVFSKIPTNKDSGSPIQKDKRRQSLKVKKQKKVTRVCSKHFNSTGQLLLTSATSKTECKPPLNTLEVSDSITNIITNIPEITEEFDVPEYVKLDNERKIEMDLIHKYITNPVCDENGYYINDHDYLGLPIMRQKTEICHRDVRYDHDYSMKDSPACLYCDLRHFCNICQCNNLNLFSFNTHMMLHTIKNDVVCHICGQKFLTTSCLNNHIATHKTICDICGIKVPIVQIVAHREANQQQKKELEARNKYKVQDKDKINFCIFCMKSCDKHSSKKPAVLEILLERKKKVNAMAKKKKKKCPKNNKLKFIKKIVPIEKKLFL